jgi:cation:H+ antiporter
LINDIILMLALLFGIIAACTLFTNAIEWIGEKMNLSAGAVGSVLAAVGTALPETIVPIVAIISGVLSAGEAGGMTAEMGGEIGLGAILGAPFMLATLAMFISGLAIVVYAALGKRSLELTIDRNQFFMDVRYFFIAYALAISASFLPQDMLPLKWGVALALLGVYAVYLKKTLHAPETPQDIHDHMDSEGHEIDRLYLQPKAEEPSMFWVLVQTVMGLAGIIVLAHLFVHEIQHLAEKLHLNALVLSLIIIPIATELPEKFNSVVWLGKSKDTLAMGNLTGAMVFQSCVPVAVGVAFTPWVFTPQAWLSVILCLISKMVIAFFLFRFGKNGSPFVLMFGGLAYAYFVWQVVAPLL